VNARQNNGTAQDQALAKKGRMVGLVIAITMVLWVIANFTVAKLGLEMRYSLLFDFAALAALFWAMVVIWQMWQARQADKKSGR
jgi:hypothetical protein